MDNVIGYHPVQSLELDAKGGYFVFLVAILGSLRGCFVGEAVDMKDRRNKLEVAYMYCKVKDYVGLRYCEWYLHVRNYLHIDRSCIDNLERPVAELVLRSFADSLQGKKTQ